MQERGGQSEVWLVYLADPYRAFVGSAETLIMQRAFWTRGESYAYAHGAHEQRRWQHYDVFRIHTDVAWASGDDSRVAESETTFGRSRDVRAVQVGPASLAAALE